MVAIEKSDLRIRVPRYVCSGSPDRPFLGPEPHLLYFYATAMTRMTVLL
jgi:hypothetical protein